MLITDPGSPAVAAHALCDAVFPIRGGACKGDVSRLSLVEALSVVAFGLIGYYAASLLDFTGLARISVDLERLFLYTYPLIVILRSAVAFGQPILRKEILAFGMTYVGLALVVVDDRTQSAAASGWGEGVLLLLLSAVAYAVYLIGSQKIIGRLGAKRYTALAMLAATGGVFLHYGLSKSPLQCAGAACGRLWLWIGARDLLDNPSKLSHFGKDRTDWRGAYRDH